MWKYVTQLPIILFSTPGQSVPFRLFFVIHDNEGDGIDGNTEDTMASKNEQSEAPGGIVGFSLNYAQQAC